MNEDMLKTVSHLEDERCAAMTGNDFAKLQTLLADDLIYTHSSAKVDSKSSYIESMRSGEVKYQQIEREDVVMRMHGTAVVIAGRARIKVQVKGVDRALDLRFSNVWVKRGDVWQFALWHATPIPKA
jgi:ketosteroid isomerase-like protein